MRMARLKIHPSGEGEPMETTLHISPVGIFVIDLGVNGKQVGTISNPTLTWILAQPLSEALGELNAAMRDELVEVAPSISAGVTCEHRWNLFNEDARSCSKCGATEKDKP